MLLKHVLYVRYQRHRLHRHRHSLQVLLPWLLVQQGPLLFRRFQSGYFQASSHPLLQGHRLLIFVQDMMEQKQLLCQEVLKDNRRQASCGASLQYMLLCQRFFRLFQPFLVLFYYLLGSPDGSSKQESAHFALGYIEYLEVQLEFLYHLALLHPSLAH